MTWLTFEKKASFKGGKPEALTLFTVEIVLLTRTGEKGRGARFFFGVPTHATVFVLDTSHDAPHSTPRRPARRRGSRRITALPARQHARVRRRPTRVDTPRERRRFPLGERPRALSHLPALLPFGRARRRRRPAMYPVWMEPGLDGRDGPSSRRPKPQARAAAPGAINPPPGPSLVRQLFSLRTPPDEITRMHTSESFGTLPFCGGQDEAEDTWHDKWEAQRRTSLDEVRRRAFDARPPSPHERRASGRLPEPSLERAKRSR